jgi:hypothetical protein
MSKIDIILSITNGSPNKLRERYFIKNNISLYNEIIYYTHNISDINFKCKIWHWVNNEPSYILCECGNRLSFNMNWLDGYKKYCSNKCSANNKQLRENSKNTLLMRYGVDHYSKTKEYLEKVKKTSIERYGVDNFSKTYEYVEKSKKTYLEKYGVDSYTKTDEYLIKSKNTCIKKYGVDSYTKTKEFQDILKKTNIERYGVDHLFKSDTYRGDNFNITNNKYYIKYVDGFSIFKCDCGNEHNFEIKSDDYFGRIKSNNKLCTICYPISNSSSIKETMLFDFICENYNGTIKNNYRDGLEIDIYLPDLKIGFEFNGLYWHSEKFKEKNYHLDKTNYFKEKDIRIIHIYEDDWVYRQDILKSQIKNILKINTEKIFARKCKIKEINIKECKQFLNENHIQGVVSSNIKIGLYYGEELVSLMTFNTSEGRKKMEEGGYNLNRFCNKLNINVVGGASKLLRHFERKYNPVRIISYADKDWSIGDLYHKLGFKNVGDNGPDYKYIINMRRVHKSRYKKSKLNTSLTESKQMKKDGFLKIYDCGKLKFEIKKSIK